MDFDMGTQVAQLRDELRALVSEQVPPDYLGAFTDDPADPEVAQSFCRPLAERGLLCMAWPAAFGGRSASDRGQTQVRPETWAFHEHPVHSDIGPFGKACAMQC